MPTLTKVKKKDRQEVPNLTDLSPEANQVYNTICLQKTLSLAKLIDMLGSEDKAFGVMYELLSNGLVIRTKDGVIQKAW